MQKEEGRMMKSAHFPILHSSFILLNSPVTGSFYYHCDWHASHYVKVMLDQIFGEN
jgi:adenine specific DNA methylase Mod